jgi:hypothetical protein
MTALIWGVGFTIGALIGVFVALRSGSGRKASRGKVKADADPRRD